MSKLVELYVTEIKRPNSGVTIDNVPALLQEQVTRAMDEMNNKLEIKTVSILNNSSGVGGKID